MPTSRPNRGVAKKQARQSEQERRLELFADQGDDEHYDERRVDETWYVKHWHGRKDCWVVDKYKSDDSFHRYKEAGIVYAANNMDQQALDARDRDKTGED